MIAVDANILVYAHREDSEWHAEALAALTGLANGARRWAIPWPCVHEFIAITTHPSMYVPPTPIATAFASIEVWLSSASCRAIGEGVEHFEILKALSLKGRIRGPMVHDTRIAAICLENGVAELWSADRDFGRYDELKVVNPLIASNPVQS
jgi:toxin-antitoxin system PIN domain toxin